ncbi:hypothetical protein M569_01666 [Genlisea aurea]|uniref:Uncharacterized protein n=1 Tax=Genlisea aurea TaxID=192259 RepID=S8D121_9LAMI|nr:hypothetical protein M569_01666 [Genlisea aurea]
MRRERISERMKMLLALVPGCDKFLSMKLASVNPTYDFTMDLNHEQNWGGSQIFGGMQDASNGCCHSNFLNDSPTSVLTFRQNPNLDPTPTRADFMWELNDQVERYRQMEIGDSNVDALFSFN